MEYTIKKIAYLAGISTRTLRYYDQINLLKPKRINSSGYRIYGEKEVDRLQQILFFRELDVKLETIQSLLDNPHYSSLTLLEEHKEALIQRRTKLDKLIQTINRTLASKKGEQKMTDIEKFQGFKHDSVAENEAAYGEEIRRKYGNEVIDKANSTLLRMTESEFANQQTTEKALLDLLQQNTTILVPSEIATQIFKLHKEWLTTAWGAYSAKAHLGLSQMYVASDEFTAYYDSKCGAGATVKLAAIITHYLS